MESSLPPAFKSSIVKADMSLALEYICPAGAAQPNDYVKHQQHLISRVYVKLSLKGDVPILTSGATMSLAKYPTAILCLTLSV